MFVLTTDSIICMHKYVCIGSFCLWIDWERNRGEEISVKGKRYRKGEGEPRERVGSRNDNREECTGRRVVYGENESK